MVPLKKCEDCGEKKDSVKCQTCFMATQKVYVENNLLAYVASHVDGSSKVKLIEAVVIHYSQDAIIQARRT